MFIRAKQAKNDPKIKGLTILLATALLGQASVVAGCAPLGVCALAAVPKQDKLYCILGALCGALFVPGTENKLIYAAVTIILFLACWFQDLTITGKCAVVGLSILVCRGLSVLVSSGGYAQTRAMYCDFMLGVSFTYVYGTLAQTYQTNHSLPNLLKNKSVICAFALCSLLFVPRLFLLEAPLALVFASLLTLCFSAQNSPIDSSLVGCVSGLFLSVCFGDGIYLAQLAFGGIAAKYVSGKLKKAMAFSCVYIGGGVLFGLMSSGNVVFAALGVIAYLLISPRALYPLFGSSQHAQTHGAEEQKLINAADCLNFAADISRKVALANPVLNDSEAYQQAIQSVCANCENQARCIGENYDKTCDCLYKAYQSQSGGDVVFEPYFFCSKKLLMSTTLQKIYETRLRQRMMARSFLGIKEQCAASLSAAGSLLYALAAGVDTQDCAQVPASAALVEKKLKRLGFHVLECLVWQTLGQGLVIKVSVCEIITGFEGGNLANALEQLLDIPLSVPEITRQAGQTNLCFAQVAPLSLLVAVQGTSAEKISGDCFSHFSGGDGITYLLLCDGMGTGGEGAAFGRYTCTFLQKMLQGGLPKQQGVGLLSSTMPLGCGHEGVSTLDLIGFNSFSGLCKFSKAGAPQSVLLTPRGVVQQGEPSTPLGIGDATLWEGEVQLKEGDILLMHTDGVRNDGHLQNILWQNRLKTPQQIATAVIKEASDSRDDCTVVVAKVIKEQ